jgi:hypothetical protein
MGVKLNVNEDEEFPYYFATFADDPRDDDDEFLPNAELSDEEAADLRRVRAEHAEWQRKLAELHGAWHQKRHGYRRPKR